MLHVPIIFWWRDSWAVEKLVLYKVYVKIRCLVMACQKYNITKGREDEIKNCFEYTKVEFHYPNDTDELDLITETFRKDSFNQDNEETNKNFDCSIFGENKKFDRLIVVDDVSDLGHKSNDFSNFLTVSRKIC